MPPFQFTGFPVFAGFGKQPQLQQLATPPAVPALAAAPAQSAFDPFNNMDSANKQMGNHNLLANGMAPQVNAFMANAPMAYAPPPPLAVMGPPNGIPNSRQSKRDRDSGKSQNFESVIPQVPTGRRKVQAKGSKGIRPNDSVGTGSQENVQGLMAASVPVLPPPPPVQTGIAKFASMFGIAAMAAAPPPPPPAITPPVAPPPPANSLCLPFPQPSTGWIPRIPGFPYHVDFTTVLTLIKPHEMADFSAWQWDQIALEYQGVVPAAIYAAHAVVVDDAMQVDAPAAKRRKTIPFPIPFAGMFGGGTPVPLQRADFPSLHEGKSLEDQYMLHARPTVFAPLIDTQVPRVLEYLLTYLWREEIIEREGIFRCSGDNGRRMGVYHLVSAYGKYNIVPDIPASCHLEVAETTKQFLREVRGGIVPETCTPFIKAVMTMREEGRMTNDQVKVALQKALFTLSPWNLALLQATLALALRIREFGKGNQLATNKAIAVIFGPVVFRDSDRSETTSWDWMKIAFALLMEHPIDTWFRIPIADLPEGLQAAVAPNGPFS
ncbi:hypothetical protein AMAG_11326 [Allomyces macrogynus ATCC 38327]|uniref:Rho-GAP domain-containing protein n=1 Tax=Allomyces macrogynus (strain ATCC 38327) TaxID=578462 RepID=A0A0L0SW89_ALLM3|nr:hypothetical protein AMAG_11326 [Allomyces macrogynus ATCC 38327]|eukprot:KNE66843.1 hypothetical protein AMAG_11326 [Allomyces macrogynus ATCC 38327]